MLETITNWNTNLIIIGFFVIWAVVQIIHFFKDIVIFREWLEGMASFHHKDIVMGLKKIESDIEKLEKSLDYKFSKR